MNKIGEKIEIRVLERQNILGFIGKPKQIETSRSSGKQNSMEKGLFLRKLAQNAYLEQILVGVPSILP